MRAVRRNPRAGPLFGSPARGTGTAPTEAASTARNRPCGKERSGPRPFGAAPSPGYRPYRFIALSISRFASFSLRYSRLS